MTESPAQRAAALLQIHGGSCFVLGGHELTKAFSEMEKAGLVRISKVYGGLNQCAGMIVRSIGFTPVVLTADDEPPAH